MRTRILVVTLGVILATAIVAQAIDLGPQFLVRVDLSQRAAFDNVAARQWEPVFRWGNQFYFVLSAAQVGELDGVGIPHAIVDDHPFRNGDYVITSTVKPTAKMELATLGADKIDQMGEAMVWKPQSPTVATAQDLAEGPMRITDEPIPLVYRDAITQSLAASFTDPMLDTIAARMSLDSIIAYDTYLMGLDTRYVYTSQNDMAQNYIRQKFLSFGYSNVVIDTFDVNGWDAHNVICIKTGTVEPDKLIVIGAHYDSYNTNTDPMVYAPGADDNGSGTVSVMEIARALAGIPTEKTIVFIAFDAEELGLIGSGYYATRAWTNGTDIELMLNMDMIGYDPNNTDLAILSTEPVSEGYADLAVDLSLQYTGITGIKNTSPGGSSDHVPFTQAGYNILYAEEYDFNTPGWHTDIDIISRMDMPYLTDVAKTMGLAAYAVSVAPSPVSGLALWDYGDGQRLRVDWTPSPSPNVVGYNVLVGTSSGNYGSPIYVAGGAADTYDLTGLSAGVPYYVAVTAVNTSGFASIVAPEASLTPLVQPRVPASIAADVELGRLVVSWNPAVELDFDHYVLYRGVDSLSLTPYVDPVTTTSYSDVNVVGSTRYYYSVVSVDATLNQSDPSPIVSGIPATFDQGILVFDLTGTGTGNPTDQQQEDVYNAIFAGYQHAYYKYVDFYNEPIDKSLIGQYGTIFWIDDDLNNERWPSDHYAKLDWYMGYGNGVVITGWLTAQEILSSSLLHDDLGCGTPVQINQADCVGGLGQNGFPDIVLDTAKLNAVGYSFWGGKIGYVSTLVPTDPGAEVIYRYNSATDNPTNEAKAVAVRRDTGYGKIAFLSLPLYYIRNADAMALIAEFANWFGQAPPAPGDLHVDGAVDILDVVSLIDIVFTGQSPSTSYAHCDVNADCKINVLDAVLLIDYVFRGGIAPVLGCA